MFERVDFMNSLWVAAISAGAVMVGAGSMVNTGVGMVIPISDPSIRRAVVVAGIVLLSDVIYQEWIKA